MATKRYHEGDAVGFGDVATDDFLFLGRDGGDQDSDYHEELHGCTFR